MSDNPVKSGLAAVNNAHLYYETAADKYGPSIFRYLGVAEEERVSEATMNEIAVKIHDVLLLNGACWRRHE
jgi:hypothetical protein